MSQKPAPLRRRRPFAQVDVFTADRYRGNPLAVVVDAGNLTAEQMQEFANWTNLSETAFLLPPIHSQADYRVRIFTPQEELTFAGHPTLGSAHAWLEAGGVPKNEGVLIQECDAGLIPVRKDAGRLAFAAPPLTRSGPVDEVDLTRIAAGLRLSRGSLLDAAWLVNGPNWIGVLLDSASQVLDIVPDYAAMKGLEVGVIGAHGSAERADFEVRTFVSSDAAAEDPVTGSFNAGVAQWLIGSGRAPASYTAAQGTVLGRAGMVHVDAVEDDVWVGGNSITCISGTVVL